MPSLSSKPGDISHDSSKPASRHRFLMQNTPVQRHSGLKSFSACLADLDAGLCRTCTFGSCRSLQGTEKRTCLYCLDVTAKAQLQRSQERLKTWARTPCKPSIGAGTITRLYNNARRSSLRVFRSGFASSHRAVLPTPGRSCLS